VFKEDETEKNFCDKTQVVMTFSLDKAAVELNDSLSCVVVNSNDETGAEFVINQTDQYKFTVRLTNDTIESINGTSFPKLKDADFNNVSNLWLRIQCKNNKTGKVFEKTEEILVCGSGGGGTGSGGTGGGSTDLKSTVSPVIPPVIPVNPTVSPVIPPVVPVNPTVSPVIPSVVPVNPTVSPVIPPVVPLTVTSLMPTLVPVNVTLVPVNVTVVSVNATVVTASPPVGPTQNITIFNPNNDQANLDPNAVILSDNGDLFISDQAKQILFNAKDNVTSLVIRDPKVSPDNQIEEFNFDVDPFPTTRKPVTRTNLPTTAPPDYEYFIEEIFPSEPPVVITTSSIPPLSDNSECSTNQDCNSPSQPNLNVCVNLSTLNAQNVSTLEQSEALMRTLQFLAQKDPDILLRYNKVAQLLKFKQDSVPGIIKAFNLNQDDLKKMSVCVCNADFKGYRCQTAVPGVQPSGCDSSSGMSVKACDPRLGVYRDGQFLLTNNLQSPSGLTQEYRSYFCECTSAGVVGVNCEYRSMQCQAGGLNSEQFVGSLTSQVSICDASKWALVTDKFY